MLSKIKCGSLLKYLPTTKCAVFFFLKKFFLTFRDKRIEKNTNILKSFGYTLIEMLIVLVILGIIASISVFYFGDFGQSERLKNTAEQFKSYLEFLEEIAILKTTTFAIIIHPTFYETLKLSQDGSYRPLHDKIFQKKTFQNTIEVKIISSLQNQEHPLSPQILIDSQGFINPFHMYFSLKNEKYKIKLTGLENGDLLLEKHSND